MFAKSVDNGQTWSPPVRVDDGADSSANYPDLACGNGYFYVVWMGFRASDTDVFISWSDTGDSFGTNIRVNDNYSGNQYEPHVSVDSAGLIHVCWIWNIPFQSNIDLFYTVSLDGGNTWLDPAPRVNDIPYVLQPYVTWTSDILADDISNAYIFWNDGRDTDYYDNIYFAKIPSVTVPTPTPACLNTGDVIPDGMISSGDAQLAFWIVMSMYTPTFIEECAADCDANGMVTSEDSQMIFNTALHSGSCVDPI
jgi:hypothetical protein